MKFKKEHKESLDKVEEIRLSDINTTTDLKLAVLISIDTSLKELLKK